MAAGTLCFAILAGLATAQEATEVTRRDISRWISQNKFLVALILVLLAGYTVGKDWAMRENARDAASPQRAGNR